MRQLEYIAPSGRQAGILKVRGVLDFGSVPQMSRDIPRLIAGQLRLTVDLSEVTQTNSAGLALLLELNRLALHHNCRMQFRHIPQSLIDIIHISELDDLLSSTIG